MSFIELIQANPVVSIILFSLAVSLFITIINYFILDKDKMRKIRERQKELQKKMKDHKDNPEKMMEIQKELMAGVGESFKHSLKPMIITLIPILILFGWLRGVFNETSIASSWIWWYIGSSLVFSMVLRKVFKLP